MSLHHRTTGRSVKALLTLLGVYAFLLFLWLVLHASPFWLGFGLLVTLPAVWEFAIAKPAGLTLDDAGLRWFSGRVADQIDLSGIERVRLDTRLDFSVKATVLTTEGRKMRIPQDALPAHRAFEDALRARDIRVDRHFFALFN